MVHRGSLLPIMGSTFLCCLVMIFAQDNQPPNRPILIAPEPNATVAFHRQRFQVKVTDPEGNRVKFKIVVMKAQPPPPPPSKGRQGNVQLWVFDQTKDPRGWDKEDYASEETATFTVPQDLRLPEGKYLWWAMATDDNGQRWSERSQQRNLEIVPNRAPSTPTLLAPEDGAVVLPTPMFVLKSIDEDGDQVQFEITLSNGVESRTFKTNFVDSGSEATYTIADTDALPSGQWTWRTRAIDEQGKEGEWSIPRSFLVNRKPSVPNLIAPINGVIVLPTPNFVLRCDDPEGDEVRFEIAVTKIDGSETKTFNTNFSPSGVDYIFSTPNDQPLSSGQWRWKVKAVDSKGAESNWSREEVFEVNRQPSIPNLLLPEDGAIVPPTPTFKTKADDPELNRVRFVIEVRKGNDVRHFETGFVDSGVEVSFTVPEDQPLVSGTWIWRAKAIDEKGQESGFSDDSTFTVNQVPNVPEIIEPKDDVVVSPTPTFKFTTSDPDRDQVKFEIEVTKGSEQRIFKTGFFASGQEATFTVPSDQALAEGQWTWRARAIDSQGAASGWSNTLTFTVQTQVAKPDLVPKDLTLSASEVVAGGKVTVQFKVVNQGQARVKESKTDVRLSASPDRPTTDDLLLVSFTTPALDPNQSKTHEAEVTIPPTIAPGDYYVWVTADVDKTVGQSDETNDRVKAPLKVITGNRSPTIPVLLSPSDGATVSPTPTFRLKASDPDGDDVKFQIEVTKGSVSRTYETGFFASEQEATFTVPSDQALAEGQWTWRARAIDSQGAASGWSNTLTFTVQTQVAKPDLVPKDLTLSASEVVAGGKVTVQFKVVNQGQARANSSRTVVWLWGGGGFLLAEFTTPALEPNQSATHSKEVVIPSETQPGDYYIVVIVDADLSVGQSDETNDFLEAPLRIVPGHRLPIGLNTFSLAVATGAIAPSQLGLEGVRLADWDEVNQRYRLDQEVGQLQEGQGYWVKATAPINLRLSGQERTEEFAVPLTRGWNLVGAPFLHSLSWDLFQIRVRRGFETKMLFEAQQAGWIEDYAWGWQQDANDPFKGKYVLVYDTSVIPGVVGQLEPWKGYWVYAHTDCELILPPPSQGKGRGTRNAGRVAKGNGWTMKLQAAIGVESGEALIGVAQGGRGLAVGLPPDPPTGSNGVQVLVLKNGAPLAVDVRNDAARRQEWDILVKWDTGQGRSDGTRGAGRGTGQKEVTLTFDGVGYAPKDVNVWLLDTVTGKRVYLRTQPSYRFVPEVGETERRFKVLMESGNERPLRIVGLKAVPLRGEGLVITFALTKPAQVRGEILTLTGRKVALIEGDSTRQEGTHRLIWRNMGSNGAKVPVGAYLVRLVATDEEGRQVQAVTMVQSK